MGRGVRVGKADAVMSGVEKIYVAMVSLKATPAQVRRMRAAAKGVGETFSAWARGVLIREANAIMANLAPPSDVVKLNIPELPNEPGPVSNGKGA
jgi:hypothetical protein